MPEVTDAVLSPEGGLYFSSVPSRAVWRDGVLHQDGPWEAARAEIGVSAAA
jgi:hypothetical protein